MTSNLFKYSNDGEILMGAFANNGHPYIELISIDNGPGMANPARMMMDGRIHHQYAWARFREHEAAIRHVRAVLAGWLGNHCAEQGI